MDKNSGRMCSTHRHINTHKHMSIECEVNTQIVHGRNEVIRVYNWTNNGIGRNLRIGLYNYFCIMLDVSYIVNYV
jgi:hypothetical protein